MKHSSLHSVAHNLALSLSGGISFVIGHYSLDVYSVAAANSDGSVLIDFLKGAVDSEYSNAELLAAVPQFKNALPAFCEKHGVSASDYKDFLVRYFATSGGNKFVVTIEDRRGKRSSKEYFGWVGKRREVLDHLGRRRPANISRPLD